MDKQIVVDPHSGIPPSKKQLQIYFIGTNLKIILLSETQTQKATNILHATLFMTTRKAKIIDGKQFFKINFLKNNYKSKF